MRLGETFDTDYGSMRVVYSETQPDFRPDEVTVLFDIRGDKKRIDFLYDTSLVPPFPGEEEMVEWFAALAIRYINHNIYHDENDVVKIFPVQV